MKLIDKIMRIDELIHSESGFGFLKIRALLEGIEKEITNNNPRAIQFETELDHIVKMIECAVTLDLSPAKPIG